MRLCDRLLSDALRVARHDLEDQFNLGRDVSVCHLRLHVIRAWLRRAGASKLGPGLGATFATSTHCDVISASLRDFALVTPDATRAWIRSHICQKNYGGYRQRPKSGDNRQFIELQQRPIRWGARRFGQGSFHSARAAYYGTVYAHLFAAPTRY
jgi:hypothetical protein